MRLLEKNTNDLVHVYALAERWWDSTNTFHLPFGEMTMTPYDFFMITSLKVGGDRLVMDIPFERQSALVTALIGGMPPTLEVCRFPYNWLRWTFCKPDPGVSNEQLLRAFLLYVLGCSLLATRNDRVSLRLLGSLVDIEKISSCDWGGAGLALLYQHIGEISRGLDLLGLLESLGGIYLFESFPFLFLAFFSFY